MEIDNTSMEEMQFVAALHNGNTKALNGVAEVDVYGGAKYATARLKRKNNSHIYIFNF